MKLMAGPFVYFTFTGKIGNPKALYHKEKCLIEDRQKFQERVKRLIHGKDDGKWAIRQLARETSRPTI